MPPFPRNQFSWEPTNLQGRRTITLLIWTDGWFAIFRESPALTSFQEAEPRIHERLSETFQRHSIWREAILRKPAPMAIISSRFLILYWFHSALEARFLGLLSRTHQFLRQFKFLTSRVPWELSRNPKVPAPVFNFPLLARNSWMDYRVSSHQKGHFPARKNHQFRFCTPFGNRSSHDQTTARFRTRFPSVCSDTSKSHLQIASFEPAMQMRIWR
jgi:hypothetical protein